MMCSLFLDVEVRFVAMVIVVFVLGSVVFSIVVFVVRVGIFLLIRCYV